MLSLVGRGGEFWLLARVSRSRAEGGRTAKETKFCPDVASGWASGERRLLLTLNQIHVQYSCRLSIPERVQNPPASEPTALLAAFSYRGTIGAGFCICSLRFINRLLAKSILPDIEDYLLKTVILCISTSPLSFECEPTSHDVSTISRYCTYSPFSRTMTASLSATSILPFSNNRGTI